MTYSEKLKDPKWQKKRLEVMQRDEFRCVRCNDDSKTLNVHHQYYIKGRDPWDYPEMLLITLCEDCHEVEHNDFDAIVSDMPRVLLSLGLTKADLSYLTEAFVQRCMNNKPSVSGEFVRRVINFIYNG